MKQPNYIQQVGNSRGHFTNTENRIQKLIDNWDKLKTKFESMTARGRCLTATSRCAYATLLIMETGIRIGNESSAEGYSSINKYSKYYNKTVKTYGVTTLLKKHVTLGLMETRFDFLGKKQVEQNLITKNKTLMKYIVVLMDRNAETLLDVDYYTLQKFIKKYVGKNFKPKDLRQAYVNILFAKNISKLDITDAHIKTKSEINKTIKSQVEKTAEVVGHTATVCKSSYISKQLMTFYKDRLLLMLDNYKQNNKKKR